MPENAKVKEVSACWGLFCSPRKKWNFKWMIHILQLKCHFLRLAFFVFHRLEHIHPLYVLIETTFFIAVITRWDSLFSSIASNQSFSIFLLNCQPLESKDHVWLVHHFISSDFHIGVQYKFVEWIWNKNCCNYLKKHPPFSSGFVTISTNFHRHSFHRWNGKW